VKIEWFLQRLEAEQAQLAREAMEKPAGRDAFAYGRAVGIHAGIERAKTVLLEMIDEKERKDFNI